MGNGQNHSAMTKPAPPSKQPSRLPLIGALALLVVAICVVYLPAVHGGFIWDDDGHVTRPELRSLHGLWRIWFELGATQQYYPLVHSAFWIEHRLFGDDPFGYHLVNILLHAVAACLVFLLLRRLKIPGAFLAGAIFALHPVQVESVAWITEQKNTLSAVFFLTSAWAYLEFDETRRRRIYFVALGLFILGLLSKTVIATLPGVLLVIFWWQRGSLTWKRDAAPLLPWFGLGAVSGLFTAWVEHTLIGARGEAFALTLVERCLLAGRVVWFYLWKLVWPHPLIFVYPRWAISQDVWWQYLPLLGALALPAALWLLRRRGRGPLAAALFFAGTLFPVLGFFNVFPFLFSYVADHFQYLPSLGPIVLASAGIALGLGRLPRSARPVGQGAAAALVAVLSVLTWLQSGMYSDVQTLYRTTIARNPAAWLAYDNLGILLSGMGRRQESIDLLKQAVRLKPELADIHYNLGTALADAGRPDEAIAEYEQALKLRPVFPEVHVNLGNVLGAVGRTDEAIASYHRAIASRRDYADAHYNLGNALMSAGRIEEAIQEYTEALRIAPDFASAEDSLGLALARRDRIPEAIQHFNLALRIDPNYARAHNNLGRALAMLGQGDAAIEHYREAIRINPDYAEARNGLGAAYARANRMNEAIEQFQQALRIKPDFEAARVNLRKARHAAGQGQ
jgi:tetratricopeptide (TPR) repeat protein